MVAAGWGGFFGTLRGHLPLGVGLGTNGVKMPKFRPQVATRRPDGQINRPCVHEAQFEAPDISAAIFPAREYQMPPHDGLRWLMQTNKPELPDIVVWATTARDGIKANE